MLNNSSSVNYAYKVYGLKVKSEILIHELPSINDEQWLKADVSIKWGVVKKEIDDAIVNNDIYKLSKKEFYLHIKDAAYYYVANGNSIIVEPEVGNDIEKIKLFLLGTCLGALLIQRNTVAIHGGSAIVNGKGIIITGRTGAGKSTLISAFRNEGYAFLADDVSALGIDVNGNTIIHPTYPQQKLCKDAMDRLGYNADKFLLIDSCRNKYSIPLEINFHNFTAALGGIYEINIGESDTVEIEEILGNDKIRLILRNIYRIEISSDLGFDVQYFKQCLCIAKTVPVYRIKRPRDKFTVNEQMKLIKDTLMLKGEKVI